MGSESTVINSKDETTPIAIVGLSCRLPGVASNPDDLWRMCVEQRDVWQPVPKERINNGAYYHPDPGRNGTSNVRGGHFLKEEPGLFDATFFNLTSTEARAMDPQQRILLELSYEALENAGIPLAKVVKSETAVFVGSSCRDYADLLRRDNEKTELFQSTGVAQTMLSNRISYFFDLNGPSVTVDTACSSSLVALHLACNAIRAGDARMAIVGGSNLILTHEPMVDLSMLRFLSPDGRCYTYDERGNGFGRGEGAACLILKRFDDALRDGDTVRAVIRNTGTNQDGRTVGISLPSGDAQVELMERTYRAAGLDPAKTSYVEAHGTGTPAGDPIEAASLSRVIAQRRSSEQPLFIGSIKSNIGHLEGASGVAGIVKTVLMLENNLILPNFDFQKASARIPMEKWNIQVPKTVQRWPVEDVHRVSVNNFGFGGSNAHVIIDDACGYMVSRGLVGKYQRPTAQSNITHGMTNGYTNRETEDESRVFLLSAFNESSGKQQAKALGRYLLEHQDSSSSGILGDLAYTLGERRSALPWSAAFVAASLPQLAEILVTEEIKYTKSPKSKNLGFVFTGQGAQWHAMGRELIHQYPIFRRSLELAEQYLRGLGAPWSLLDELSKDVNESQVKLASLSQPLTTAIQVALVDLLASWSVRPTRVTGHSSGEIAAAYCVGALSQESAMAIAYHRGRVAMKLKDTRDGAMLAVGLPKEEAQSFIAALTSGSVNVACVNSPSNVTVSGDRAAILELSAVLQTRSVFARELVVDVAYHSHHMNDVAGDYLDALHKVPTPGDSKIEFHSSVSGKRIHTSDLSNINYWVSNMIKPVQFSSSTQSLLADGDLSTAVDILVEIGPHSALQGPVKQILQHRPRTGASSVQYNSALVRNTDAIHTCHALVAQLLDNGVTVDLNAVNFPLGSQSNKVLVDLPPYPWNHSVSYWADVAKNREQGECVHPRSDILGVQVKDSMSTEPRWRNVVRPSEIPWVNDHVVQSNVLYPAAGFLAMAIEAEHQHMVPRCKKIKGYSLREITIGHALIVPQDTESVETMVSLRPHGESLRASSDFWHEFCISSSVDKCSWTEHCRGLISIQQTGSGTEVDGGRQAHEDSEYFRRMTSNFSKHCTSVVAGDDMYKALKKLGLNFGPTFKNLHTIGVSSDWCLAEVSVPDTAAIMPSQHEYPFIIHPATLDSCIHAVFPIDAQYNEKGHGTPVPTFIEELFISHDIGKTPGHVFSVYADKIVSKLGQKHNNLAIFDKDQLDFEPRITFKGLKFASLANNTQEETQSDERKIYYQTDWQPDPSYLSSAQATELTAAFRTPFPQNDQASICQQVAFYYADTALEAVSNDAVKTMQRHHQKLYRSLTSFCDTVRTGQLGMFATHDWLHATPERRAEVISRVKQLPYGILLCPVGEKLSQILLQEIEPLSVMVEDDRLERYYRTYEPLEQSYQQAAVYIKLLGYKNPHLNILEIGAGTGGATLPILEGLSGTGLTPPHFTNYDLTDLSTAFFEKAREKLERWNELITYKKLDIESDPVSQGYEPGSYDLIVAANVVHATCRIEETMKRIRNLLKPGGTLILIEVTVPTLAAQLVFGTLPGWWNAEEKSRTDGPLLTEAQWDDMLHASGFTGAQSILWDMADSASHHSSTIISTAPLENTKSVCPVTIIDDVEAPAACSLHLKSLLEQAGIKYDTTTLSECDTRGRVCIVLSELTRSVLRNPSPDDYAAIKRVFLDGNGVLWVTAGALLESSNPDSNLVTGLARTIKVEKGDTTITTLDLDSQSPLSAEDRATKIFSVFLATFGRKNAAATETELEYVERNGMIMVPRIIEDQRLNSSLPSAAGTTALEIQPYHQENRQLKAEIRAPGLLDSIEFVDDERIQGELPDDCVEVQVKASGINFRDVMTALGQISAYPLGCECCGVISAVGKSVEGFQTGDHVIATVKDGCFCTTIRASADEVEKVPQDIPFEIAASLPVVYFTAYWAVLKVARLCKDESVLIHAGSGGLGQAIINLCQLVGAKIFATVGTLEKKRLLMEKYNVPEENIFSSRDTTFAKGIMRATDGRGVDVIMNSLSGEALRVTWNCIAPFGRFVELGKRDFTINSRLEMRHFEKNVSFTGLDVPLDSCKGEKRRIWAEIMNLYQNGSIQAPSPITVFGISELEKALRRMQSGRHMGKMVLMPRPEEMVKVAPPKADQQFLRDDASYLLIGGLGGIGRATAFWMLKHGARNFIFASPSGSDKEKSKEAIALLEEQGARVSVHKCDISKLADLDRLLDDSRVQMPPIRGMIHGALVSKADLFGRMTLQDYNDVMRPKVDGIWNLHDRLSKTDLDFFIMLSSVVGTAGDPSQAAYVSASVFQDAFADYRTSLSLPAVTLDLGKVVDIGIVAEKLSAMRGVRGLWSRDLREAEVMSVIEDAIRNPLRKGVGNQRQGPASSIIGLKSWEEGADPVFNAPLFSHFRRAAIGISSKSDKGGTAAPRIRDALKKATTLEAATEKVCTELIAKASSLLMVSVEDISPAKSLADYGMDSLVAVEMRNWLLRELEAALPILELMASTSLRALSEKIVRRSKIVDPGIIGEKEGGA